MAAIPSALSRGGTHSTSGAGNPGGVRWPHLSRVPQEAVFRRPFSGSRTRSPPADACRVAIFRRRGGPASVKMSISGLEGSVQCRACSLGGQGGTTAGADVRRRCFRPEALRGVLAQSLGRRSSSANRAASLRCSSAAGSISSTSGSDSSSSGGRGPEGFSSLEDVYEARRLGQQRLENKAEELRAKEAQDLLKARDVLLSPFMTTRRIWSLLLARRLDFGLIQFPKLRDVVTVTLLTFIAVVVSAVALSITDASLKHLAAMAFRKG